jgi:scyllo-inositol 2-dehydrogenase (NADP+)
MAALPVGDTLNAPGKLRGGVVGLGRMGLTHYAILNTHPRVRFVAGCDSTKFVVKTFERFADVELYEDGAEMLAKAQLDFVIVSTPTQSHAPIVRAAIERGLHVFVEKPFTLEYTAGAALVEAVDARRLVNQVGYFLRFNPVLAEARRLVAGGAVGEVVHYKNEMYGRAVVRTSKAGWRAEKKMGGGCLLDFASHCLDMSDWFFGPVKEVGGSSVKSIYSQDVEDCAYATLFHESGASGSVLVTWSDDSFRRPYNRIEILGRDGRLVADRQEFRVYRRKEHEALGLPVGWSVKYLPELEHGVRYSLRGADFTAQLDHFVEKILAGDPKTNCTFEDALRTDLVIEKIRSDAK